MALIKCAECGHPYSTDVNRCPSCGAKRRMPYPLRLAIGIGGFAIIAYAMSHHSPKAPEAAPEAAAVAAKPVPKYTAEEEKKFARCKADLANTMAQGIVVDIKTDWPLKVYTGPRFYRLTPDQRSAALDDVNCVFVHGTANGIELPVYDRLNNTKIGTYLAHKFKLD